MTWSILGFEGVPPSSAPIAWGLAVLAHDERLFHSATRSPVSESLDELVSQSRVSALPRAIEVDERFVQETPVVLMVSRDPELRSYLRIDPGRAGGGIETLRTSTHVYYAFRSFEQFCAVRDTEANTVVREVLGRSPPVAEARRVLRSALVLHARHPELLALSMHFTPGRHKRAALSLARASLASSDDALNRFNAMHDACSASFEALRLKYEDGVATGGGLDVDVASRILTAFKNAGNRLQTIYQGQLDFLPKSAPLPRLRTLEAHSAELVFASRTDAKDTLGERVARHFLLSLVTEALVAPEDSPASDPKLSAALGKIVSPSPETTLSLRTPASSRYVTVASRDIAQAGGVDERTLRLLAFHVGLIERGSIELRLLPRSPRSSPIRVRAVGEAGGDEPEGVEYLRTRNNFLYEPFVVTLRWQASEDDVSFALERVDTVTDSPTIDALPSTIVDGAFLVGLKLPVQAVDRDTVDVALCRFSGVASPSKASMESWLALYASAARELEFAEATTDSVKWLVPPTPPAPSALDRVAVSVDALGGSAAVDDVVEEIVRRYRPVRGVRRNNTRRVVIENPGLLRFETSGRAIELTDHGRVYARVLRRAGGDTGNESR